MPRAKDFRTVRCIDCGTDVPALNTRMRRCQACMYRLRKEMLLLKIEENEQEIVRL